MKKLIAIDNGHGLNTQGKRTPIFPGTNSFIHEWEFNHPTAKKLGNILKENGFIVLYTSDTEKDTPLKDRSNLANEWDAHLFVSIHFNALTGKWGTQQGIETYHHPSSKEGKKLADLVHKNLIKDTQRADRKVKSANFHVLRETKMPAILAECGFMDNLVEARLMLDEDYQMKCARAIAKGICEYFDVGFKEEVKEDKLYKVQVGAYSVKENAEALLNDLKNKGFNGFIAEHTTKQDSNLKVKTIRRYDSNVHILEIPKDYIVDVDLGKKNKLETVSSIVKDKLNSGDKIVAGINLGFFNYTAKPEHLGMLIDEGLYYYPPSKSFIDFIYYKDGSSEITNLHGYDKKLLSSLQGKANWAVGTSYSLMQKGKINLENTDKFSHSKNREPRTLVGIRKDGTFILVVVDGRSTNSKGVTANQSALIMQELNCYNAFNADGGGSSTMVTVENGTTKLINRPSDRGKERQIGSTLLVYKK